MESALSSSSSPQPGAQASAPSSSLLKGGKALPLLPLLAMLPAFLGGGTERWSQGVVLGLLGLLFALRPPRVSLGRGVEAVMLGLLLWAGLAFLPASWFTMPQWRLVATHDLGLSLPATVTTAPGATAEAMLLLLAGLGWVYYTCAEALGFAPQEGNRTRHRNRRSAVRVEQGNRAHYRILCQGVVAFAAVSLFFYATGLHWPFPEASYLFGPFPNRNQTADLLAIGGILCIGMVHETLRKEGWRGRGWVLWMAATVVVLVALVLAYSRAAIILFFTGLIIWIASIASVRRSTGPLVIGAAVVLILWSAFLFGGGKTLNRFLPAQVGGAEFHLTGDLRWSIQQDALGMALKAPEMGVGLGNFESQFWMYHRQLGFALFHVLHPESDWVWLLVEMGWIGVGLVAAGLWLLGRRIGPLGNDAPWRLRAAAAAGAAVFLLHGAVDVSGHRLGTFLPAVLVGTLALRPGAKAWVARPWLDAVFRAAGVLCMAVGVLWMVSPWLTGMALPVPGLGAARVAKVKAAALAARKAGAWQEVIARADEALPLAPLDADLYLARGMARAMTEGETRPALLDFRRARYLNPISPQVPYNEGVAWVAGGHPMLALPAWQEALKRAGNTRQELFRKMVKVLEENPVGTEALRLGLQERAQREPGLMLAFLETAPREAFAASMEALLRRDPDLRTVSPDQRRALFAQWAAKVTPEAFLERVQMRDAWLPESWPHVAAALAARGEHQRATELAFEFLPKPVYPTVRTVQPSEELQRGLYLNPHDFSKAYALYTIQMRIGATEQALETLTRQTAQPDAPAYFSYLEAQLQAQGQHWREAWAALQRGGYVGKPGAPSPVRSAAPSAAKSGRGW